MKFKEVEGYEDVIFYFFKSVSDFNFLMNYWFIEC